MHALKGEHLSISCVEFTAYIFVVAQLNEICNTLYNVLFVLI